MRVKASSPIFPSPILAWRSLWLERPNMLSLMWIARSRSSPITRSNSASTPSRSFTMSYPASKTWQVSRQTPMCDERATRSRISRSSSKREPTSLPLPAIVSSSTVVVCSGSRIWFSVSAICAMPVSTPCPTWLPG